MTVSEFLAAYARERLFRELDHSHAAPLLLPAERQIDLLRVVVWWLIIVAIIAFWCGGFWLLLRFL